MFKKFLRKLIEKIINSRISNYCNYGVYDFGKYYNYPTTDNHTHSITGMAKYKHLSHNQTDNV